MPELPFEGLMEFPYFKIDLSVRPEETADLQWSDGFRSVEVRINSRGVSNLLFQIYRIHRSNSRYLQGLFERNIPIEGIECIWMERTTDPLWVSDGLISSVGTGTTIDLISASVRFRTFHTTVRRFFVSEAVSIKSLISSYVEAPITPSQQAWEITLPDARFTDEQVQCLHQWRKDESIFTEWAQVKSKYSEKAAREAEAICGFNRKAIKNIEDGVTEMESGVIPTVTTWAAVIGTFATVGVLPLAMAALGVDLDTAKIKNAKAKAKAMTEELDNTYRRIYDQYLDAYFDRNGIPACLARESEAQQWTSRRLAATSGTVTSESKQHPAAANWYSEQEARRIAHIREVQNAHTREPVAPPQDAKTSELVTPPQEGRPSETMQSPAPESSAEVESLKRIAEQGNVLAQNRLGQIYARGDGIPKDIGVAVEWWKMAAAQGHSESQYNLAVAYFKGIGHEKDLVLAHAWLNIAVAGGRAVSARSRYLVKSQLSKAERLEAQRLSSGWKKGQSFVR